jgi:lysophospholipase L1-like esterase
MKEMRENPKPVKKSKKASRKRNRLLIFLIILPIVVIFTTCILWLVFPAGALNQNSQEVSPESDESADTQTIIDKIDQPLNAPEPESQETSKQIAEQKRIEAEEKIRLEKERVMALEKALKIKQARDEARNKICFIGDSISVVAANTTISALNAGYSTEDPPYDNINIARDGSTTGEWAGSIASDAKNCVAKPNLKLIMIMLGTNDARSGVETAIYLSNMTTIRSAASNYGVPVIVNCPIATDEPTFQSEIVKYCDHLGANGVAEPLNLSLLPDGIHPNGAGYSTLAGVWAGIIRSWVGV